MATRKKPMSATQIAEANVKQLRIEAELPRIKVSEAVKDLQDYIEAHQDEDYLVRGFDDDSSNRIRRLPTASTPKKNPFRKEKLISKACKIL